MALQLVGNNRRAYRDRASSECLISGPVGTGKTYANLLKMIWFGGEYPRARMLMVRKTRAESGRVGDGHPGAPAALGGAARPHRRAHAPARVQAAARLDHRRGRDGRPEQGAFDRVRPDLRQRGHRTDGQRLGGTVVPAPRTMAGPFDQMLADCNPESKYHWVYKRFIAGRTPGLALPGQPTNYATTHFENPGYYDWPPAPGPRTASGT